MSISSHTAQVSALQRAYRTARVNNVLETVNKPPVLSRREFLGASAALLTTMAVGAQPVFALARSPRIAIVGAGIAGLNAAYQLGKAGLHPTLYEGAAHIGGRIRTAHNGVAPGVSVELGGEFIDSAHEDMLSLVSEFGLDLIDTQAQSETGLNIAYYANGRLHTDAEVVAAFQPLAAAIDVDSAQLSDTITYQQHSAFDVKLDRTNLRDYLRRQQIPKWLFDILEAAYVNEYGLELEDQSSLNFVETIGTDTSNGFQVYGESDQRYKVRGGNDQVVHELARRVRSSIELEHRLEALERTSSGQYLLTFQVGCGAARKVTADIVILCLPFTILREIELRLPLPAVKRRAIRELGYGTNAKVILGFQSRVWRAEGFGGDSYADLPYQSGWDSSREQASPFGAYTLFAGGNAGLAYGSGTAFQQARFLLPGLNRVFPGVEKKWLGTALRAFWPDDPFVRGSYAAYRPGQWTGIRGAEGETVGNLYFAGEHTSLDWQGFMNGGAESGRLAAEAVLSQI